MPATLVLWTIPAAAAALGLAPTSVRPACFETTAEAAVASAFTPALAAALAECHPSLPAHRRRSRQAVVVVDNVLGEEKCRQLRAQAEALRDGDFLERAESSGDVRAIQCAQGEESGMRGTADDLVALPLAIARGVAKRMNEAVGAPLIFDCGRHTSARYHIHRRNGPRH